MTIREQAEALRQAFKEQYGVEVNIQFKVFNNLKMNFSPEDAYKNAEKVAAEMGVEMPNKHMPIPKCIEETPEHETLRWYEIAVPGIEYTVFFNEPQDTEKTA